MVGACFESVDGAPVLVVAQGPKKNDGDQRRCSGDPATRTSVPRADFFVDQRKERRSDQSEQQADEHDGLEDEDDVP